MARKDMVFPESSPEAQIAEDRVRYCRLVTAACAGWTAEPGLRSSVMKALAPIARRQYNQIAGLSAALSLRLGNLFPLTDVVFG